MPQAPHEPPVQPSGGAFGPNAWLVDDMYEQYRSDPESVSASWRDFFADYVPPQAAPVQRNPAAPLRTSEVETQTPRHVGPPPQTAAAHRIEAGEEAAVLRAGSARLASNMEASLSVPTATSVRTIAARLLELNRSVLNRHLARTTGAKVSFTHMIGFAIVRGLQAVASLNASYVPDADGKGHPGVVHHKHVGLGLAVDVARPDGSRSLLVPVVRDADTLDFRAFVVAYEELIRKVHMNKALPDDFAGATVTLTNPGTLGTMQSVPRLMPGQGAIIGVGALGYPPEYEAADRRALAEIGVSSVVTLTSTYDHRIIQGAESGLFLTHVTQCLSGAHSFYEDVFDSMDVPYEPVKWQPDVSAADPADARLVKQVHVQSLINMYRVRGHLIADLDPLGAEMRPLHSELDPTSYGLTLWDLGREFVVDGLAGSDRLTLGEALDVLRDAYCRTMGVEYMHIQDPAQKRWIQQQVEGMTTTLEPAEQHRILDRLNAAEAFERFLHTRYVGQKRFGLEGAESTIVVLDTLLDAAAKSHGVEAVIGMAHRGRLNVLANIVGKSYGEIFREFEGDLDPESVQGSGDVKYHKGAKGKFVGLSQRPIDVTLASNPSHLEAVDPVVEGMARAKQDRFPSDLKCGVVPILIHGDAAFAGQGVVAETLELSQLAGYHTGGTLHVVVNNQLGFTTAPESARSSVYPTDVAKMVQSPIIHVNGDDPEACHRAAQLAFGFRQEFHKDVVIDLVCYRRYGHNEGDDPSYTQPKMYALIESKRSVRKLYTEALVRRGDITLEEADKALADFQSRLQAALDETRQMSVARPRQVGDPEFQRIGPAPETGVEQSVLQELQSAISRPPDGFTLHPKLARQFEQRAELFSRGEIDWALAEALAFGSLLLEGTDVRLAGQDTRRGTFSQRHSVLVDHDNGDEWVPLSRLAGDGVGRFDVRDSLLSEYAALGFEYGYSVEAPEALVAWEAQFGDFGNGAQIVIDNFLVSAEDKWGQRSGLALLLPHGYEGQGPEHSSARMERFLTLCARDNMRIAQPTTSSQYFHLLRSQVRSNERKPLVVFTPKWLLRARESRSSIGELSSGRFESVLDDPSFGASGAAPESSGSDTTAVGETGGGSRQGVQRVLLCSGKVAFDLMSRRQGLRSGQEGLPGSGVDPDSVAILRVEQLYPWPEEPLVRALDRYPALCEVIWVQEEPENMGAWSYAHGKLHRLLRERCALLHASRDESASPATGSAASHHSEQEELVRRAFA